jgi:NAD(P)H-hydrate epimerase
MESSGNAVARVVRNVSQEGSKIAIVCGRGNNGGDAFVSARFLDDFDVEIYLIGRPESIISSVARENWDVLQTCEYVTHVVRDSSDFELNDPDIIIDGLLGTGINGIVREPDRSIIEIMNNANAVIISVDIPSGFDSDKGDIGDSIKSDYIVTFHDMKPGIRKHKNVIVADIGIPKAANIFVGPGDLLPLNRPGDKRKGDFGKVMVIGGGPYTGAPLLCSLGVLRSGADLVYTAVPSSVSSEIQGYSPDIIVEPFEGDMLLPEHVDSLVKIARTRDVVVIGPGLGDEIRTLEAVKIFLESYEGKIVIDADALKAVKEVKSNAEIICTPHKKEFASMGGGKIKDGLSEKMGLVEKLAKKMDVVLLVKGDQDIISNGEITRVNRTGNPGMTVGGTGDILAGVVGGLFCTQDSITASTIAAYVVGKSGDIAVKEKGGFGIISSDILQHIPRSLGVNNE